MMQITLIFSVMVAAIIFFNARRGNGWRKYNEDRDKIDRMIQNGSFPRLSDEEQVLFVLGENSNFILKKLGVRVIDSKCLDRLITMSKDDFKNHLREKRYLDSLCLKNQKDGIWIKSIEGTFETVDQERGRILSTKSHKSLDSMIDYLSEVLLQNVPKFRSTSYPIRD